MRFTWKQSDGTWSMLYIFGFVPVFPVHISNPANPPFSILELTIGNICACMPVMTPLLKKTGANLASIWSSVNSYYYNRRGRTHYEISDGSIDKDKASDVENNLPKVPRATLTGLRTFLHGSSSGSSANRSGTDAPTLLTVNSEDQSYHVQLKTMYAHNRNISYDRGTSGSHTLAGSARPDSRDTK